MTASRFFLVLVSATLLSPLGRAASTINVDLVYTGNDTIDNPANGTAMTATIANRSMVSNNCAPGTACTWGTPPGGFTVGADQAGCHPLGPVSVNNGGPTYSSQPANFHSIAFANTAATVWRMSRGVSAASAVSIGECYYIPVTTLSGGTVDINQIVTTSGKNVWPQFQANPATGKMGFDIETSLPSAQGSYFIEPDPSLFPGYFLVGISMNSSVNGLSVYGTYSSGGSVSGSTRQYCNVNFTGGQSGYVLLSGTNSLTGSPVIGIAAAGTPWTVAPTSGTLSSPGGAQGATTCSGTINISGATLGGVATMAIHDASTGALLGEIQTSAPYSASGSITGVDFGNGENYTGVTNWTFQNILANFNANYVDDIYSPWQMPLCATNPTVASCAAASCSSADIQAAVALTGNTNSAVTVNIPACTETATTANTSMISVTPPAAVTTLIIQGQGTTNTTPSQTGAGTPATILFDKVSSSSPLFNITWPDANHTIELSSIEIDPVNSSTTLYSSTVLNGVCSATTCGQVRINNILWKNWANSCGAGCGNGSSAVAQIRANDVFGVIDHNTDSPLVNAPGYGTLQMVNCEHANYKNVGIYGDSSWHEASPWGTANALFIENNLVNSGASITETEAAPGGSAWGGCRMVVRFNHISGNVVAPGVQWHGTDTSGRPRAGAQAEIYANPYSCNKSNGENCSLVAERGGNAILFGNQLSHTGTTSSLNSIMTIQNQRRYRAVAWGVCGAAMPWDVNDGETILGPWTLTGVAGSVLSVNGSPWTANAYQFSTSSPGAVFYVAVDATTGDTSPILSNTTGSLTVGYPLNDTARSGNGGLSGSGYAVGHNVYIMGTTLYDAGTNSGGTSTLVPSHSWTASQWAPTGANLGSPFTLVNVAQGLSAEIATNGTNSMTYVVGPTTGNSGTPLTWANGDAYAILRATQCVDQPNRAQEQLAPFLSNPSTSANVPTPFQPSAILYPAYEMDDSVEAGVSLSQGVIYESGSASEIANRDWYSESLNQAAQTTSTSPFNGSSGTGHGTIANRPTACTPGVGYWATDQGSWNQSGLAYNPAGDQQGQLSVCMTASTYNGQNCAAAGSNYWCPYYTPYTYPHPLVTGASPTAPSVTTTTPATNVAYTSATVGGTVTSDGGATVTSRGACYGTSANPTTPCTSDGAGTGDFSSPLTGLNPSTLYHYRAFATNSAGTSYGTDQSFTTSGMSCGLCVSGVVTYSGAASDK